MLNHKGTVTLETDRLILRKFELNDAEAMYNNWASDDEVTKYVTWNSHANVEVTKEKISEWVESYKNDNVYQWIMVLKETNEPIGAIAVVKEKEVKKIAELGACIGKKWWGKGYTAEALKKVVDFLLDDVNYNRIEAVHVIDNPNSGKAMIKAGFKYEGILRQRGLNKNKENIDLAMYSILKSDIR